MKKVVQIIDRYAPIITKTVPARKMLHEPWMTPGLVKSSHTLDKLYKKSLGKDVDSVEHKTRGCLNFAK